MFIFSLIIPTINRKKELELLFSSLVNQTFTDFEVIVVDQNSDFGYLSSIVNEYSQQLSIKHIHTLQKGASKARNIGIENVSGLIITFPDDDCEYSPFVLEEVRAIFTKDLSLSLLSVSTIDKKNEGQIFRSAKEKKSITKHNIFKTVIEFGVFYKKNEGKGIRFNEQLGVGSHTPWWSDEGPDFVLKFLAKGLNCLYYPDIKIFHPNPIKIFNEKTNKRSFDYGMGRGHFLRINHYNLLFVLYVWSLYLIGIMLSIFILDGGKLKYYYLGLKGRVLGYFDRRIYE